MNRWLVRYAHAHSARATSVRVVSNPPVTLASTPVTPTASTASPTGHRPGRAALANHGYLSLCHSQTPARSTYATGIFGPNDLVVRLLNAPIHPATTSPSTTEQARVRRCWPVSVVAPYRISFQVDLMLSLNFELLFMIQFFPDGPP